MKLIRQKKSKQSDLPFGVRATVALGVSIVADALDYIGAPIFALPILGDISDAIVMATLYRLTGSKASTAINSIEFIPLVGDMIPAYTISTLLWILRESYKRKDNESLLMDQSNRPGSIRITNEYVDHRNTTGLDLTTQKSLRAKARRHYAIFGNRAR
jgi:hypothetical protein